MRFLADESCDFAFVRALKDAGHDVLPVASVAPGSPDEYVLDLAVKHRRVLLTEDKDFGRWIYANRRASSGIILLRYRVAARFQVFQAVVRLVENQGDRIRGSFVTVQPARIRIIAPPHK
jgi:predicted nuclease of predicted toxin-antitoxin system